MNATDAASLQNLHDIVPAPPVPWWPPAAGWYFAGAVVLIVLAWIAWAAFRRWKNNAYRRAALKELKELTERLPDNENAARKLPELVKRTALCAWPRRQVADLSGMRWLEFLDDKGASKDFTQGPGKLLPKLAYADSETVCAISRERLADLTRAVERWIKNHKA